MEIAAWQKNAFPEFFCTAEVLDFEWRVRQDLNL